MHHSLESEPVQLVRGERTLFASVREYLKHARIQSAYPHVDMPPATRESSRAERVASTLEDVDRRLTAFRHELAQFLSITTVLADGHLVKVVDIDWSQFQDPQLGPQKLALFVH